MKSDNIYIYKYDTHNNNINTDVIIDEINNKKPHNV